MVAEGAIEFRVDRRQPDGARLVLDVTANYLEAADVLVSHGRDITRRVLAEEALRAEQTNLAAIFEASPVAMLVCDAGANVVRVNRAALRLAGRDEQRLLEHRPDSEVQCGDVLGCVHHLEADGCGTSPECPLCPLRNAVAAVLEATVSMRGVEFTMDVLRDGEPEQRWLRIGAEPMVMDGAPHVTVAVDDITDRRRAERDLRESEERFEQFADHFPGYLYMYDAELRCVYANQLGVDGRWYRPRRLDRQAAYGDLERPVRGGRGRPAAARARRGAARSDRPVGGVGRGRASALGLLPHPARRDAPAHRRALDRCHRAGPRPRRRCAARRSNCGAPSRARCSP